MRRWWWAVLLFPSLAWAQPALYPGTSTSGFVAGQGTPTAITKWVNKGTIGPGSLADTATQANKSVCFADGNPPLPVLNCGDAGIKYTKGATPTLNLGVNGSYQINGVPIVGGGGSFLQLAESTAPSGVPGFDILYADSSAHRLKANNNNGGAVNLVVSGVDINTSDQVTALHLAGVTNNVLLKASSGNAVNSSVTDTGALVNFTEAIDLTGQTAPSASAASHSKFYFDSGTNRTKLSENTGSYSNILTAASTDTLTGKTIDSASNTVKIAGTSITSLSGNTGKIATVSGSLVTATDQVAIDGSGNLVEVAEAVRTFVYTATTGATTSTTSAQFMPVNGVGLVATESNIVEVLPAVSVTSIQCGTATAAPGTGNSWTLQLRDGTAGSNCGAACTISNAGIQCSQTIACTPTSGHGLDIEITGTGTPVATALTCLIQGTRTG